MNKVAIKNIFTNEQFLDLLQEYYSNQDDFDDHELEDYCPEEWNVELHNTDMNRQGVRIMRTLGNEIYTAFNTTQLEDNFFSAITISKEYEDIFVWFVNFAGIEDINPMSTFDPHDYSEY